MENQKGYDQGRDAESVRLSGCYRPDPYERGFLMAISLLMYTHNRDVEAIDVLQEEGLQAADVSYFEEFDKRQFRKLQGIRGVNFKGL